MNGPVCPRKKQKKDIGPDRDSTVWGISRRSQQRLWRNHLHPGPVT